MWTCNKCNRVFEKTNQMHSCKTVELESHFVNKKLAKELFEILKDKIVSGIGPCSIISLPCCVHLYGQYDFLAALPKKDHLEIRFALNRKLDSKDLSQFVQISGEKFKNCINIKSKEEIDSELMGWIKEAYYLK